MPETDKAGTTAAVAQSVWKPWYSHLSAVGLGVEPSKRYRWLLSYLCPRLMIVANVVAVAKLGVGVVIALARGS